MTVNGGEIEVNGDRGHASTDPDKRDIMGRTGRRSELPNKDAGKSKKPPPAPIEDDDSEDGDIATPKPDRNGDDDQPL